MNGRLGFIASLPVVAAATAAPPLPLPLRPTGPVDNCATSECHTKETRFPHLHGPVAAGACEMCHTPVDQERHRFELKRTGAALCSFCHLGKVDRGDLHVHRPVAEGKCVECHDPHGSADRMMLRLPSRGELCLSCHATVAEGTHLHAPLAAGDCTACHRPHSSMHAGLLTEPGRDLCLRCHNGVRAALEHAGRGGSGHFNGAEAGSVMAAPADHPSLVLHGPVAGDCLQCHRPHAAEVPGLLTAPPAQLCAKCHTEVFRHATEALHPHAVATDDRACLNCHEGHVGTTSALLRAKPVDLCLGCHGRDITRQDGTVLAGLAELADPAFHRHRPLADGGCSGCHDPHGGANDFLLTRPFSGSFYQKFDTQAYALCFECHEAAAFETPLTTDLTRFRDGDRNLHYAHVTAPPSGGRNCRVCHSAHAGASPQLLREEVAFGRWRIPIGFKATETGGSCAAGCHRARSYDRVAGERGAGAQGQRGAGEE